VNKTADLFNLAYTNDKAPAPPKRDRGIADIGGLAGMALKQEDEMSEELEPVAWLSSDCRRSVTATEKKQMLSAGGSWAEAAAKFTIPLYTGTSQEQPEQPEQPDHGPVECHMWPGWSIGMSAGRLTAARLRELMHYDPATGVFTSNTRRGIADKGSPIRGMISNGYSRIGIAGIRYAAHRLAWLYVHGEWPKQDIDHINGDKLDNRISNLRDVSTRTNTENRRTAMSNNKSKLLGVRKMGKKWAAHIGTNGRTRYLGSFLTPEEAHAAYLVAKRELHAGCTI
jgi:hypothetical protein